MKSRLKKFIVTINYSHESYNGYDHNDGNKKFEIEALNEKSASKKALKIAYDEGGGYERRVVGWHKLV